MPGSPDMVASAAGTAVVAAAGTAVVAVADTAVVAAAIADDAPVTRLLRRARNAGNNNLIPAIQDKLQIGVVDSFPVEMHRWQFCVPGKQSSRNGFDVLAEMDRSGHETGLVRYGANCRDRHRQRAIPRRPAPHRGAVS
jgi:hypothetical protein